MLFSLKQLQIFEQLAIQGSYTMAAKHLYLSQPAVSMQIKKMEERIGLDLFERDGKRVHLTQAGEALLHYCEVIRLQLEEAETVLEELKGLRRGKLHLTMAATANYFAPQLIAAFHEQYPDARVTLDVTNRAGLLEALALNRTDMAIMGRPPKGAALQGTAFMDNPLVLIAAPNHVLAKRRRIPLAEIAAEPLIVRERDSGTRMAAERFFDAHDLKLSSGMEMNRTEAVKQAVMAELGLGIVSLHALEMELSLRRLVVLDVVDFPIMRQWFVVHRQNKKFTGIPEAFKQFVLSEAKSILGSQ